MQCPSCGAISKKRSLKCPECGAFRNKSSMEPTSRLLLSQTPAVEAAAPSQVSHSAQNRSLIEFPGVRNSMPQWRKELGERVREVQERRLRESALENGSEKTPDGEVGGKATLLELLPQAEVEPLNPLVVAALRRIERANVQPQASGNLTNFARATAVAYAEQPEFTPDVSVDADSCSQLELGSATDSAQPERTHTLAVVPHPPPASEVPLVDEDASRTAPKPKRLIGGDRNDPALNYLDTIPTDVTMDDSSKRVAPIHLRIFSAVLDVMVVCLLSWLPLALSGLTTFVWHDVRALSLAITTAIVVAFLYSMISTALTGQTLGMKLFSLRVVDARTRMLPTGSQSAGRAVVYLLSVGLTGLPLMFTLIDRDKRAPHDRFTRTEVVRI